MCCFRPGQSTPRHSHGDSTREAVVVVVQGEVQLERYTNLSDDTPHIDKHAQDDIFVMDGNVGEHSLCNHSSSTAITLHVYHPPYIACCFSRESGEVCQLPVVYGPDTSCDDREALERSPSAGSTAHTFTNLPCLVQTLRSRVMPIDKGQNHTPEHIAEIINLLSHVRLNAAEWGRYSNFALGRYTRNLIGFDEKFTVLLLCWEKGQMSPIHDHAGSSCWVKVLHGSLREVRYETHAEGYIPPTTTTGHASGHDDFDMSLGRVISDVTFESESVTYINDTQGLHKMGNAHADDVAVSLHIYSPPYQKCHVFEDGGNIRVASITAANQPDCPFQVRQIQRCESSCEDDDKEIDATYELASPSCLSVADFAVAAKKAIDEGDHASLPVLLGRLVLNPKEWSKYVHFDEHRYTRNLILNHDSFSLMLLCWNKGQMTPVHSHRAGTQAFFRVVKGSLVMKLYNTQGASKCKVVEETVLTEDSPPSRCCVRDDDTQEPLMHKLGNLSNDDTAVSLHLYTPAYIECCYDHQGQAKMIPVVHCGGDRVVGSTAHNSIDHDLRVHSKVFTNICSFVGSLRHERWDVRQMTRAFQAFEFNPHEWRQYIQSASRKDCEVGSPCKPGTQITMPLVASVAVDEGFSVLVCQWSNGIAHAVDYDGCRLWLKVLEGTVREETYTETEDHRLEVTRDGVLGVGAVAYWGPNVVHSVTNEGKSCATALMVFRGRLRAIYKRCVQTNQRCLIKCLSEKP